MRVSCPSCQTNYNIDDKRVPPGGAKLKCAKCQTTFPIKPGGADAIPLPGGGQGAGAIPLPGSAPAHGGAIPLPGTSAPAPAAPAPWDTESTRVMSMPVPAEAYGAPPPAAGGAIPLPGGADFSEPPTASDDDVGFADADLVSPGGPVPLPGAGGGAIAPPPPSFDFGDLPPPPSQLAPAQEFGIDFGEPAPSDRTQAAAPMPDFSDLPSPAGSAPPPAMDFSNLPSPADFTAPDAPMPAVPSFDNLPSPHDQDLPSPSEQNLPSPVDFGVEFDAAPPPPRQAPPPPRAAPDVGFGEVDFAEPAAPAAHREDPLEFDPTAAKGAADDLEADLSAPIPAPQASSGPADGLEMLNFIDDAAKDGGGARSKAKRFHIRRRSGKTFGPFDEGVVVKMLEDGQLLGNEDVSTDGESWSPMATVASFGQVISKLMEGSGTSGPTGGHGAGTADSARVAQSAQSMDRLKQLYEGRMAAVAVVDRRDEEARFKRRLPIMIAAGVILVVALAGGSLGLTRYGVFGIKKLWPASLSTSSPQHAQLQAARKALLADTFKSYQEARDLTGTILQTKEYPEVRAVWCQAVYYLQRRYAAASAAERKRADEALPHIELLGLRNVEVAKALVGAQLAARRPNEALPILLEAKGRAANDADLELDLLLAETHAATGDVASAQEALARVLAKENLAKALHLKGNLHQKQNETQPAVEAYAAALKADPQHVASAVELAAMELLGQEDPAAAEKALREALTDDVKTLMGPAELARAKALLGVVLAGQFKADEAQKELDEASQLDPDSVFAKAMLGRVLIGRREFEKALPLYKEANEREPQNLEYTDGYLQTLIATGKMSDALNAVQSANARFPGNARIAYLFGTVSDALDDAAEAEGHYKRAVAADAELFEANLALARFYLRFRREADARPQLEEAVKKAPNDAAVRSGMGELALAEDDVDTAAAEFERAVSLNPNLADAHLGLARVAGLRGDHPLAQAEAEKALALDANLKGARLERSLALWRLGQLDEAIAELERARVAEPKSAKVAVTLGAVKYDKGDLAGAESSLLTALTMEPSNHEAHFRMARVKSKRAEHTQAIDSMRSALEYAPNRADYHYEMGLINREAKKFQEAIDEWRQTAKLDPNHADALEALGQLTLERGDVEGAVSAFDRALKADPKRTRILGLVGDAYFQAARWNDAINRYEAALRADKSLVHLYYRLGRAFAEKGNGAKALSYYQLATRLDDKNPMPFYYLGFAYKERGKRAEAIAAFKRYLERNPAAEDKREIEDEIYDLQH